MEPSSVIPGPGRPRSLSALDLRHLSVLCEVARHGSFAGAADALSFTPSAISQQMSKLERDIGATLFERSHHGTSLTPAGDALRVHAEAIFARVLRAESELALLAGDAVRPLRVGSFPTATGAFVADAFRRFRARSPTPALQLVDGEPFESAARLQAHDLELAVVFEIDGWPLVSDYAGQEVCATSSLVCEPLFDDPFLLAMRHDHPLAGRTAAGLADLSGERIVGSPRDCPPWGAELRRACAAAGVQIEFDDAYHTVDFPALQAVVASGRGISLMPELAIRQLRDDLCTLRLDGGPVRRVSVARHVASTLTPEATAMVQALREAAGDRPRAGSS